MDMGAVPGWLIRTTLPSAASVASEGGKEGWMLEGLEGVGPSPWRG
jgi:hypothetical protein